MEKGHTKRELRTTEPLPEIPQFLREAAVAAGTALGRDANKMMALGLFTITTEAVGTSHSGPPELKIGSTLYGLTTKGLPLC
jgi:hypothetical protein